MAADSVVAEGRDRLARIDESVYGLTAVLKSAYRATGRSYLHLQRGAGGVIEVRLRAKRPDDDSDAALREFLNDLIDQGCREIVARETQGTRDLIMAHALSRSNLISPGLESANPEEDPHGISVPDRRRAATP